MGEGGFCMSGSNMVSVFLNLRKSFSQARPESFRQRGRAFGPKCKHCFGRFVAIFGKKYGSFS